jgi:menaquinol-cytochrome c reductase iron-sulfur subunit
MRRSAALVVPTIMATRLSSIPFIRLANRHSVLQRFAELFVISPCGHAGCVFSGMDKHHHSPPQPDRRNFIVKAAAIVVGGLITVFPVLAGLFVFLDPLRRKSEASGAVFVGSLSSLPENGTPVKRSVLRTQVDIWNRTPNVPVGAVYVQRIVGTNQVRAVNAKCPHAGCFVNFKEDKNHYHCPCHNSSFSVDGQILDPDSPSPRALDELVAEVRNDSEIWVHFRNFRAGVKERHAIT